MSIACSSTPVLGVGSFNPSGRFAAPRSYYVAVWVGILGWTITQNENEFTYHSIFFPNDTIVQVINPSFWEWSSNGWTFDHIVCESYYHRLLTGAKDPAPYGVQFRVDPTTKMPVVQVWDTDGLPSPVIEADLPPPPPGYWLPAT